MSQASILTLTLNPTVDMTLGVATLNTTGKSRADLHMISGGGGGINVARVVKELGGQACALHTAGGDVGARLCHLLDAEGLDHRMIPIDGETREAFVLTVEDTDASHHIVLPGPPVTDADAQAMLDELQSSMSSDDLVVASGSLPPGLSEHWYRDLSKIVARNGGRLVLDISGPPTTPLDGPAFLVRMNGHEAGDLLGRPVRSFAAARRANNQLIDSGVARIAVTTIGEQGAIISTAEQHHIVPTPSLPCPVLSDAGAGDSLVGAMTLAFSRGKDAAEAGAWGVAAAAASVMTPGTELCQRSEVEELHARIEVISE